jgi:protein-S-isoprenylcysteine O-methyltransferase Ste14
MGNGGTDEGSEAGRLGWALVAGQFALLGGLALELRHLGSAPGGLRALGVVMALAGVLAIGLASSRLGPDLRAHPAPGAEATLRTDGPYRLVRHPIYSGLILFAVGLAAIAATALAAALVGTLVLLLSYKMRLEERLLAARFRDYEAYARRTPRLIPRIRAR